MEEEKRSMSDILGFVAKKAMELLSNAFPGIERSRNENLEKKVSRLESQKEMLEKSIKDKCKEQLMREKIGTLKEDLKILNENKDPEKVNAIRDRYLSAEVNSEKGNVYKRIIEEKEIKNAKEKVKELEKRCKEYEDKYKQKSGKVRELNQKLVQRKNKDLSKTKVDKSKTKLTNEFKKISITEAIKDLKDQVAYLIDAKDPSNIIKATNYIGEHKESFYGVDKASLIKDGSEIATLSRDIHGRKSKENYLDSDDFINAIKDKTGISECIVLSETEYKEYIKENTKEEVYAEVDKFDPIDNENPGYVEVQSSTLNKNGEKATVIKGSVQGINYKEEALPKNIKITSYDELKLKGDIAYKYIDKNEFSLVADKLSKGKIEFSAMPNRSNDNKVNIAVNKENKDKLNKVIKETRKETIEKGTKSKTDVNKEKGQAR